MNPEGDTRHETPVAVSFFSSVVINGISCPFTVLVNVLVIMAVKRRPRLQSNTNILLACLAVTDVFTGLTVQPSFIAWTSIYLFNFINSAVAITIHNSLLRTLSVCSLLHLMLVTCERLVAIKFTMNYHNIVTKQNIKVAVISVWAFTIIFELITTISNNAIILQMRNFTTFLAIIFCIIFIASAYVILYRETRRHEKKIKTQQLPQEEVERFAKESKALKTTVFVVSAVVLSFLPMAFTLLFSVTGLNKEVDIEVYVVLMPLIRTCAMLNSLLNPLIYCLRQKEMRKFVFRVPCRHAVQPAMNDTDITF
ncbi:melanocortin receptor 4-like [Oculina patagonica]